MGFHAKTQRRKVFQSKVGRKVRKRAEMRKGKSTRSLCGSLLFSGLCVKNIRVALATLRETKKRVTLLNDLNRYQMYHHQRRYFQLTFIVFLLFFTACQQKNRDFKPHSEIINNFQDTTNFKIDYKFNYYPENAFIDTSKINDSENLTEKIYSNYLYTLKEPEIYTNKSQNEMYRFLWLRSFHNPIAIRIEKNGDNSALYWKESIGPQRFGKLITSKKRIISKEIWDEFKRQFNELDFWIMPTTEKTFGCDGSSWILEGKNGEKYHVVDRWSPKEGNKYFSCCNFLIGLTDLKFQDIDKY